MSALRQTNFSAGEVDPKLWGRTDLPLFSKGLRRCRNFFVSKPHGAAVSRPGTLFVLEAKKAVVRLVPFVFSDSQTYCLEFGDGYIRFHTGGATIVNVAGSYPAGVAGQPYEVATEYAEADLARLRWVQSGDVLFITCPGKVPYRLIRYGHVRWVLEALSLTPPSPRFVDLTVDPVTQMAFPRLLLDLPTGDAEHPQREWRWCWTCVLQEKATGQLIESRPYFIVNSYDEDDEETMVPISSNNGHVLYGDKAITIKLGAAPLGNAWEYIPADWPGNLELDAAYNAAAQYAAAHPADFDAQTAMTNAKAAADVEKEKAFRVVAYNIYRGRGDLFGFVGQTKTREFVDIGEAPDYLAPPPYGFNPFYVRNQAGTVVDTETPTAVGIYQDRLVLAGTQLRPDWVFTSWSGDWYNFDPLRLPFVKKALEYRLGSRRREGIRHVVGANKMLVLTDQSAWSFSGQQGEPLSDESPDARLICDVGSTDLQPLIVDGALLYARTKGLGAMALAFDSGHDGFAPLDITRSAQHLFIGQVLDTSIPRYLEASVLERKLADWCHAEDPWGLVWACRKDGMLLSLTIDPENQSWGWARHDTDGKVLALAAVPEGEEDAVYMAVERRIGITTRTYIERMASRVRRGTVEDDCAVDCGVRFDIEATETVISGLDHLKGKTVRVIATGNYPSDPLVVSNTGTVTIDPPLRANVGAVMDGLVEVTPAHVVGFVGLTFTPELETLDVVSTDTRSKPKIVKSVLVEVDQSIGLYTGQDFDNLKPWKNKRVSHGYNLSPAASELVEVFVKGTWDKYARAAIRQSLPLPVTVLGITREVEVGGP